MNLENNLNKKGYILNSKIKIFDKNMNKSKKREKKI